VRAHTNRAEQDFVAKRRPAPFPERRQIIDVVVCIRLHSRSRCATWFKSFCEQRRRI